MEYQDYPAIIGQNIRVIRARNKIRQTDFAKKAGLTAAQASRLEKGEGNPQVLTLAKAAAGLGVPLSEMVREPDADTKAA